MTCGIYRLTNTVNGKAYIGQSIHIEKRIRRHSTAENDCFISRAIRKYGISSFCSEVIEECGREDLNKRETYYVAMLNTLAPHGYNLTSGGGQGTFLSGETKAKISAAGRGRVLSMEHKERISKAHKGIRPSEDTKRKLSVLNKGKIPSAETCAKISAANKGRVWPKEFGQKISAAKKGIKLSKEHKGSLSISHSGAVIPEDVRAKMSASHGGFPVLRSDGVVFQTISAAAKAVSGIPINISSVIHGKRKTAYGFTYQFMKKGD